MNIQTFYDERTFTLTYVVFDPETRDAVIIDPVLDYDPSSSKIWTESVDEVIAFVKDQDLNLQMVIETHAHADHLSGARRIKNAFPGVPVGIGRRITEVQRMFKSVFNLPEDFATDGSQFDRLFEDGEEVNAGSLRFRVLFTPGHTPACASFQFDDAVFTGDALFMPDMGTGRCDFPGGSATDMYRSIHDKLYALPGDTRVFVGHDYQPEGRPLKWEAPISEHRESNVALKASTSEQEFVQWRETRDRSLAAPRLLFQSVQVNVDGGKLPAAQDNQRRYLRIPLNVFRPDGDGELDLAELS